MKSKIFAILTVLSVIPLIIYFIYNLFVKNDDDDSQTWYTKMSG